MFGKAPGSDMYADMFTDAIAQSAAKTSSLGFASSLKGQFTKLVLAQTEKRLRQENHIDNKL